MGLRRYRKREEQASPFEEMLSMAFGSAVVGGFLAVVFLVLGLWLRSQPTAAGGLAPVLGGLMLILAGVLAAAPVIGCSSAAAGRSSKRSAAASPRGSCPGARRARTPCSR